MVHVRDRMLKRDKLANSRAEADFGTSARLQGVPAALRVHEHVN